MSKSSRKNVTSAAPRARAAKNASSIKRKSVGSAVHVHATKAHGAGTDDLHWTETLLDGTHVVIRPIRKGDIELERAFIKFLSPESRRMRFLGQMNEPSDTLLKSLTDIDYQRDMALIALVHRDGETQEIGVSRYSKSADGNTCECAVVVSDAWQHRGLATVLMRHLIEYARSCGIRRLVSFDASENTAMRDLAAFLGFERRTDPDDPHMVIHSLAL